MAGNLDATISDIRGSMFYVTISYDNGYASNTGYIDFFLYDF